MKSALRGILTIAGLTAAAVLPSALRAQGGMGLPQGGMALPLSIGANGSISISVNGMGVGDAQNEAQSANTIDPLEKLLARAGDGKHAIVVIDSVRASEDDLIGFSQSLRSGKVRIKQGGVRTLAGDSKEAEKYGAKADDKVILITTEPGTAAPADSGKAKP